MISFTKLQASGNDFILIEPQPGLQSTSQFSAFARRVCISKFGIGADGVLVFCRTSQKSLQMRIFNADGSEAEMCGNGIRCFALYAQMLFRKNQFEIMTKSGNVGVCLVRKGLGCSRVRVRMPQPSPISWDIPLKISGRTIRVHEINTGVPHAVIFVSNIEKIDVNGLGRKIRHHQYFFPRGTNVDFVEVSRNNRIFVRTYERGVEAETYACGTGTVASALVAGLRLELPSPVAMNVQTKGGEVLSVDFRHSAFQEISELWFSGDAFCVFQGKLVSQMS